MSDGPTPGQRRPRIPEQLIGALNGLGPGAPANPLIEKRARLIKKLYTEHKYTPQEIARLLKIAPSTVHGHLSSDLGGPPVKRRERAKVFTAEVAEALIKARAAGVPIKELARKYKIPEDSLHSWLYRQRQQGAPLPLRPKRIKEK